MLKSHLTNIFVVNVAVFINTVTFYVKIKP